MLVEVSVPLDVIGMVRCDYDGNYRIEVNGYEVDTDEKTYWQVIATRDSFQDHFRRRAHELGLFVTKVELE